MQRNQSYEGLVSDELMIVVAEQFKANGACVKAKMLLSDSFGSWQSSCQYEFIPNFRALFLGVLYIVPLCS
jgi:hypothetical protein